jgi:4-carboxymuconolactone decarboxylase
MAMNMTIPAHALLILISFVLINPAVYGQVAVGEARTETPTISRAGTRDSTVGPAQYFTGQVRVDPLFSVKDGIPVSGAYVTFEPGARSAWHFHPKGQYLIVTAGVGRTGQANGRVDELRAGDVVWCPPGARHWHGASPDFAMTHLAITGVTNDQTVVWLQKVTDDEYAGGRQALSSKQRGLIPIAAFTAAGDLDRLRPALHDGLGAGLTVNEIKEILVQMYAYAGFPRSLNALQLFAEVLDERRSKGIREVTGPEAGPLPVGLDRQEYGARVRARITGRPVAAPPTGYQIFAPIIDNFLKEHLFADIFARDVLDHQSRELATNAALASMTGTTAQLRGHLAGALNVGLTGPQLQEFTKVLEEKVGRQEAERVSGLLAELLKR